MEIGRRKRRVISARIDGLGRMGLESSALGAGYSKAP